MVENIKNKCYIIKRDGAIVRGNSCPKCDRTLFPEGTYCEYCGTKIGEDSLIIEGGKCDVVLNGIVDTSKKLGVVKAVKDITYLRLKESKELVDSAPKTIKAYISSEKAELLKK